jgi:hypothetical protein
MTAISPASFAASSGRLPLVNCLLLLGRGEHGAFFDGLVLEGVLDEAQRGGALGVVRLHGLDDLLVDEGFECACFAHDFLPFVFRFLPFVFRAGVQPL